MGMDAPADSSSQRVTNKDRPSKFIQIVVRASIAFILIASGSAASVNAQNLQKLSESIVNGNTDQKRDALSQVRNLGTEDASRIAIPALSDPDEVVRATAANAVTHLPKPEVSSVLVPLLRDRSEFVRGEAASALGRAQIEGSVTALAESALHDKAASVRAAAAAALGKIGSESGLAALTAILKRRRGSEDEYLRRSAARSVGQIAEKVRFGKYSRSTPQDFLPEKYKEMAADPDLPKLSPAFQEPLRLLLAIANNRKESEDTRREAAYALGAIGDPSAIPFLRANIGSSDVYLAQICREALLKIPGTE